MTTLVTQRMNTDCGPCCFAMLTGREYDDVLAVIGDVWDAAKGLGDDHETLRRLGMTQTWANGLPEGDYLIQSLPSFMSPQFLLRLAWGRRALLSVPSLNMSDSLHMVYFDGHELFDPSRLQRYTHISQLQPVKIILFRERK